VRIARRTLGWKKIGHAGTLDPSASGVLILLCGEATGRAREFSQMPKEYIARIRFGFTTDTNDLEGDIVARYPIHEWSRETIRSALSQFVGVVQQVPPAISAVKLRGRPAYARSRSGELPRLASRSVEIYEIKLLRETQPEIEALVRCSGGTYIRSLARDIGDLLGWGGTLASLKRVGIGEYGMDEALGLRDMVMRSKELAYA
jgi:tRNA pseudouridine55 synthase